MAIQNPRFEVAGQYPGEAEGWKLRTVSSLWEFAGFGDEPEVGWERFDRSWEYFNFLEAAGFVIGFFDSMAEGYEDFEENWQNNLYLKKLLPGHIAVLETERVEVHTYVLILEEANTVDIVFSSREQERFDPGIYRGRPGDDILVCELSRFA